jgi:hypothetical protein
LKAPTVLAGARVRPRRGVPLSDPRGPELQQELTEAEDGDDWKEFCELEIERAETTGMGMGSLQPEHERFD